MVDTKRYEDWFKMAKKDLQSAKILFEHEADYGIVCFHCQQAAEKFLKGYLVKQTGMVQEGHSVVKLCRRAVQFEPEFKTFLKDCALLNIYYIETRYPAEDPLVVLKEDTEECLKIVDSLIQFIERSV